MKRLLTILSILFFLPTLMAVDVEMKNEFNQGETFVLKLSGNFYESISTADIKFYRDQVQNVRTEITPQIVEINNEFYVYAQLIGKDPSNYSVVVEDVRYFQFNEIIEEDVISNFTINEGFADFSVNLAAISTEEDFSLEVRNLVNNQITIDIEVEPNEYITSINSINLNSGSEDEIDFTLENNFNSSTNYITLSTENTEYIIPAYIPSSSGSSGDSEDEENNSLGNLRFSPSLIDVSISTNSETEGIIYLTNDGDEDILDVSLFLSDPLEPYVLLSEYEFDEIDANSEERIYVYFESGSEPREIEGRIIAVGLEDYSASIEVYLNFDLAFEGPENNGTENPQTNFSRTCSQLSGDLYSSDQTCSGQTTYTIDGACCLGTVEDVEKSSIGKIIGWMIILLLIGGALWFYFKKYKGLGRPKDLFNIKRK